MIIQPHISEISLLQRIVERDQDALSALYDRYARIIYTLAYRVLGSAEESEEVVLDVFNQVWRSAANYNSCKGKVDTWLFMITRSRALDRLRSLSRAAKVTAACEETAIATAQINSPEEEALILERRDRVTDALKQLPAEQREVIELSYYKGLTHVQIAATTGKSLGTVKTRIRLGLSKLRDSLNIEI
jgi:RNA polymerase sigma factor (sigma-70 family)